jgi:hypothetical protein
MASVTFALQGLRLPDWLSPGISTYLRRTLKRDHRYLTARYTGSEKLAPQELSSGLAFYSLPRSRLSRCHSPATGLSGQLAGITPEGARLSQAKLQSF